MGMEELAYRRQYLVADSECAVPRHWRRYVFGPLLVYTHPDLDVTALPRSGGRPGLLLLGYLIDPRAPEALDADILMDMQARCPGVGGVAEDLIELSGRYCLLVDSADGLFAFNDPCGLRSVYYTQNERGTFLASDPAVFRFEFPLQTGERYSMYANSRYRRSDSEHFLPSGLSLFENIRHLVPNHYLKIATPAAQVRYYPVRPLEAVTPERVVPEAGGILRNSVQALALRHEYAVPVTAGLDSRLVMAACRDTADRAYFYTLRYRDLSHRSADIRVPAAILGRLGHRHNVIDCPRTEDEEFRRVYEANCANAHYDDWGVIARGMHTHYPAGRVALKGNVSEIARCAFYSNGRHPRISSHRQLVRQLEPGWVELPFVMSHLRDWFEEARPAAAAAGMRLIDLFYWEHRMGSWQAQGQLEWDVVQEVFTPYNNRRLMETLLTVPVTVRRAPDYRLHRELCEFLWPDMLSEPINPPSTLMDMARVGLKKAGVWADVCRGVRAVRYSRSYLRSRSVLSGPVPGDRTTSRVGR